MKTLHKLLKPLLLIIAIIALPAMILAADAAATTTDIATATALPWQLALIPILTPIIIAGVKLLAPKIPSALIPILAPILGAALDIIGSLSTGAATNIWLAAGLGLAGVGVREIVDQLKTATG